MLQTFQSSSAAERLGAASAFVEGFPTATEVLIVGASRDAADDLARRVTAARGATFGLHRASLTQLAVRFAAEEMARLGVAPATALGAEAVAARVSFEALRERALAYFAPVARFRLCPGARGVPWRAAAWPRRPRRARDARWPCARRRGAGPALRGA